MILCRRMLPIEFTLHANSNFFILLEMKGVNRNHYGNMDQIHSSIYLLKENLLNRFGALHFENMFVNMDVFVYACIYISMCFTCDALNGAHDMHLTC